MHMDIICVMYLYMSMSTPVYVLVDLFVHAKYVFKILSCAGACAFGAPVNIQYIYSTFAYICMDTCL